MSVRKRKTTAFKSIISYLLLIIGFSSLLRTVFLLWNSTLPDFVVFYHFADQLFQGVNPYKIEHIFSPPIALLIFSPTLIFPLLIAQKVWLLSSVFLFFVCLLLLKKIFELNLRKMIVIFSLSVISFPFKFTLGMGQTNFVLLFFILAFIYFFIKKREKLSAVFLSLGIAVKLFPVVFILELFFSKRWKVLFFLAMFMLFLFSIPFLLTSEFVNYYHIRSILVPLVVNPQTGPAYYDQSITGFLGRIGFAEFAISLVRITILLLTVLQVRRHKEKYVYAFVLLLTGFLLTNRFTWQHQLVLLLPAFSYLISQKLSLIKKGWLIVAYFLMMINIKDPSIYNSFFVGNLILTHGFYGLVIIWLMLLLDRSVVLSNSAKSKISSLLSSKW